jgi:hypothetical protein
VSLTVHALASETFVPMLGSLGRVLEKGREHAKAAEFEPSVLVTARLAPTMYTLAQQVRLACYHASDAYTRLTGGEPARPVFADDTYGDLEEHVKQTIAALEATPAAAFEGADERAVVIPVGGNMAFEMNGSQLLRDWSIPHFYFHVVTAYDLLRHNGVPLGKPDYVGNVRRYLRASP